MISRLVYILLMLALIGSMYLSFNSAYDTHKNKWEVVGTIKEIEAINSSPRRILLHRTDFFATISFTDYTNIVQETRQKVWSEFWTDQSIELSPYQLWDEILVVYNKQDTTIVFIPGWFWIWDKFLMLSFGLMLIICLYLYYFPLRNRSLDQ